MIQSNNNLNEQKEGSNIQNKPKDEDESSEYYKSINVDESEKDDHENSEYHDYELEDLNQSEKGQNSEDAIQMNQSEDEGSRLTIFVGGLTKEMDLKDLKTHFGQFGPVNKIKIGKNKRTNRKLGFAFVTFFKFESYQKALKHNRHKVKKTSLKVDEVVSAQKAIKKREDQQKRKIFIKGLPKQIRRKELLAYIEKFGEVEDLVLQHSYKNKKWIFKQFGFIVMKYKKDFDNLIKIGKLSYKQKTLKLEPAKLKGQKSKNFPKPDEQNISMKSREHSIQNNTPKEANVVNPEYDQNDEKEEEEFRRFRFNLNYKHRSYRNLKLILLQQRLLNDYDRKSLIVKKKIIWTKPYNFNQLILNNEKYIQRSSTYWGFFYLVMNK